MDESAITGESAPVIRESGGDRSAVTGGTTVLSGPHRREDHPKQGESFIDRMIALVEGANRRERPTRSRSTSAGLADDHFVFAVATLQPLAIYSKANNPESADSLALNGNGVSGIVMVALLVCLIRPRSARCCRRSASRNGPPGATQRAAMSGRAVEAAGDVHHLLLDKTGTHHAWATGRPRPSCR